MASSPILRLATREPAFLERAAQRTGKPIQRFGHLAAKRLLGDDWPGNIRELEDYIERAVALARFDEITVDDLPARIREREPRCAPTMTDNPDEFLAMHTIEERYVRRVLSAVGGNKTMAAKVLGFDRRTLYRKLARYQQL